MGIFNTDNPGRAGGDVAEYANKPLVVIIDDFVKKGLDEELNRIRLRKAMLVSYEVTAIAKGARINV